MDDFVTTGYNIIMFQLQQQSMQQDMQQNATLPGSTSSTIGGATGQDIFSTEQSAATTNLIGVGGAGNSGYGT